MDLLAAIFKNYGKLILVFTVVGVSASFGLSLAQKSVYVAESRLLIRYIQTQGVDAYAASRAAGKIGQIFAEVSKTELFLEKVLETPYGKGLSVPPKSDLIARKAFWEKTIDVSTGIDSSLLRVRAYGDNSRDPQRYVDAVSYVLLTSGAEFHGADGLVSVRLVDGPVSFKKSIVPSVAISSAGGLCVGVVVGMAVSFLLFAIRSWGTRREENSSLAVVSTPLRSEQDSVALSESEANRQRRAGVAESGVGPTMSRAVNTKELSSCSPEDARTQKHEFRLAKPVGSVVRTVFDDLRRLGLDSKQLTMNS